MQPDLIYIDTSHQQNDVYSDMAYYWHTLRPGGVMFGDDYRAEFYPGVAKAVAGFTVQPNVKHEVIGGQFLLIRKPTKSARSRRWSLRFRDRVSGAANSVSEALLPTHNAGALPVDAIR